MKKIVSLILLLSITIFSLSSCLFYNNLSHITDTWTTEKDENVAIASQVNNKILMNGTWYDPNVAYEKRYGYETFIYSKYDSICIKDYVLYGIFDTINEWELCQINLETNELNVLYTKRFSEKSKGKLVAYTDKEIIYINDNAGTVTYDIKQQSLQELPNQDFVAPDIIGNLDPIAPNQNYKCEYDEQRKLIITKISDLDVDNDTRKITFDYVADRHVYFDQIRNDSTKRIKIPNWTYSPEDLFGSDVQIFDNEIYLSMNVSDYDGDKVNVIFHYNYETEVFRCLHYEFTSDYGLCKVVPVY